MGRAMPGKIAQLCYLVGLGRFLRRNWMIRVQIDKGAPNNGYGYEPTLVDERASERCRR